MDLHTIGEIALFILTATNTYIGMRITGMESKLQAWCLERFATKSDVRDAVNDLRRA